MLTIDKQADIKKHLIMSNCKTPQQTVCYQRGINDAFILSVSDIDIDPLGYDFKLGSIELTVTDDQTETSPVKKIGNNVVITVPINTSLLTNSKEVGYIVSNTKNAGQYIELSIIAEVTNTIDNV